jgi:hypothetical protein
VLFLPLAVFLALEIAGIVLLIIGHRTLGLACVIAGLVLRVLMYVAARLHGRFANRNASPS